MNSATCQQIMDGVGTSVAASLRAVDCAAGMSAEAAFGRLFGANGALLQALTILLTLYVAFFAFSLITGRSRLGVSTLTPRMITLGVVLTFATSWAAYQNVVWNLAVGGPDQLAGILTGARGSATQVFADKIDIVFNALMSATGSAADNATAFSPPGLLWLGATLLLLGTVGVLATSKIALAILLGLGPVFVVLALFRATRGLFVGWLKGVVLLALAPLFAVLGGSLMLDLSVPVLRTLSATPGQIDDTAAMAFFMIGAVHVALMFMVLKVAGTMVSGWDVFGLAHRPAKDADRFTGGAAAAGSSVMAAPRVVGAPATASPAPSRDIRMGRGALPAAANDISGTGGATRRETRIVPGAVASAAGDGGHHSISRARGIGSRFRAAPQKTGQSRSTEKFK
ncbi:MAG TPA: type IV secretion system protein [Croceibacterium sp.]|nr:type IV secretion system protein [Croceibacterium sp.]